MNIRAMKPTASGTCVRVAERGLRHPFRYGKCIACLLKDFPWQVKDKVRVKATGKIGTVAYRYYNGYTLVRIRGHKNKGGIFNNNSTYANTELEKV